LKTIKFYCWKSLEIFVEFIASLFYVLKEKSLNNFKSRSARGGSSPQKQLIVQPLLKPWWECYATLHLLRNAHLQHIFTKCWYITP